MDLKFIQHFFSALSPSLTLFLLIEIQMTFYTHTQHTSSWNVFNLIKPSAYGDITHIISSNIYFSPFLFNLFYFILFHSFLEGIYTEASHCCWMCNRENERKKCCANRKEIFLFFLLFLLFLVQSCWSLIIFTLYRVA